mgnify:FL=1
MLQHEPYIRAHTLENIDGHLTVDLDRIMSINTDFYINLLREDSPESSTLEDRGQIWSHVKPSLNKEMNALLNHPFSINELLKALNSVPHHSCPGEDGLTPAFLLPYWESLGSQICQGFQEIFNVGKMPTKFSGLIYLIPKGEGCSTNIRKWRPTIVLNTI